MQRWSWFEIDTADVYQDVIWDVEMRGCLIGSDLTIRRGETLSRCMKSDVTATKMEDGEINERSQSVISFLLNEVDTNLQMYGRDLLLNTTFSTLSHARPPNPIHNPETIALSCAAACLPRPFTASTYARQTFEHMHSAMRTPEIRRTLFITGYIFHMLQVYGSGCC